MLIEFFHYHTGYTRKFQHLSAVYDLRKLLCNIIPYSPPIFHCSWRPVKALRPNVCLDLDLIISFVLHFDLPSSFITFNRNLIIASLIKNVIRYTQSINCNMCLSGVTIGLLSSIALFWCLLLQISGFPIPNELKGITL